MAKPNYSFEKRQRELAKKKKQDQKDAKKREARAASASNDTTDDAPVTSETEAPATAAGPKIHRRATT